MLDTTILPSLLGHYSRLECLEMTPKKYMAVVHFLREIAISFLDPDLNVFPVGRLPKKIKNDFPQCWYDCDRQNVTIPTEFFSTVYSEV
jgi:hypothetical protein